MDYLQLMDIPGSSSNLFFFVVAVQEKTFVQNRSGEKKRTKITIFILILLFLLCVENLLDLLALKKVG
jgi:hypothetical protein